MQLLHFPSTGARGQALEEWEPLVRQYESESSDTLQVTIKAAILAQPIRSRMAESRLSERDEAAMGTVLSKVSGTRCIKRTDNEAQQRKSTHS